MQRNYIHIYLTEQTIIVADALILKIKKSIFHDRFLNIFIFFFCSCFEFIHEKEKTLKKDVLPQIAVTLCLLLS